MLKPKLTRDGDKLVVTLSGIGKTLFQDTLPKVKAIPGRRYNPEAKVWEFEAKPMTAHQLIHQVGAEPSSDVLAWVRAELQKQADDVVTKLPHAEKLESWFRHSEVLMQHQVDAIEFLLDHPRAILADDMGLGKTLEAAGMVDGWVLREFALRGADRKILRPRLIVAPSSLVGGWADQLRVGPRDSETQEPLVADWDLGPVFVIDGRKPAPKRRKQLQEALATPGAWIIVNWEQIRAQKTKLTPELRKQLVLEAQAAGASASELQKIRKNQYRWIPKEPLFSQTEWAAVIADEAHRAKNKNAQQTRGLWMIDAPIKLALTGTPILNSPDELWSLLAWIRPDVYGEYSPNKVGYQAFFNDYVEYSEGQYGKIVTGVKNADTLRFELQDKLVRRTKGQVLDLPPKIRTTVPVTFGAKQKKLYDEAAHGFFLEVEQAIKAAYERDEESTTKGKAADYEARIAQALEQGDVKRLVMLIPNAAARITRLRQIASTPALLGADDDSAKLDAAVEIITDHPEKQFVVFSKFKGTTDFLAQRLRRRRLEVATLTGDTPPDERTALVAAFQAGDLDVLVATIEAGGVGLTLTAADTAIFIEREWVPGINEQAEDRLHRIGQNSSVNILILEGVDTVDDGRIAPKNRLKELIVSSVIQQDNIEHGTHEHIN